jgi:AcrR family transcriptional regulator
VSSFLHIYQDLSEIGRVECVAVVDVRAEMRAAGRARLREAALDITREVVLDRGWSAVRMGSIATALGITRQSLHAEFGTRDDLADALIRRETATFFEGVEEQLAQHPGDLAGGVQAAGRYILEVTRDNPLLQTVLTGASIDGDVSLLPLITTRGAPLVDRGVEVFGGWVTAQWPALDPTDAHLMVESVVRLSLSHIITSSGPTPVVARNLARLACRLIGFPDPQSPFQTGHWHHEQ